MNAPRLNVFQRLILQWERLHPYNAAQAMRLTFSPSLDALTQTWRKTLNGLGLGRVRHDRKNVVHEFEPGTIAASTLAVVESAEFNTFISHQLNRPYESEELAYRPFVSFAEDGATVGMIYHHWVCDSFCIRSILREWLAQLVDPNHPAPTPLLPAQHGYWKHFGPDATGWPLVPTLLQQLSQSVRMRTCRRNDSTVIRDTAATFSQQRAEAGLVNAVRKASRRRGVKVNDLFLVALAKTAAAIVPLEIHHRRRDLALGTIVDLRQTPSRAPVEAFGLFLGFTNTVLREDTLDDSNRLLAVISAQSRLARDNHHAAASQIRMTFGLLAGRLFSDQSLRTFYRKRFPLAGGISNVTLQNTWAAEAHPTYLREYIRVSPTGPFLPVVLTPTTLGEHMHIGITTRGWDGGTQFGERFLRELSNLV